MTGLRLPRVEDFPAPARGTGLAARVGSLLGVAFLVCFLTGIWSHLQYDPPSWAPIGPSPTQLYRVTQGVHVATGAACVPLLLVKLWSVYPQLFRRPPKDRRALVLDALERASIGVLVGSALFQLVTGLLNVVQWYPWDFSFRPTHYAVAWVAIGSLLLHVGVKLPLIREGFGVGGPREGEPTHAGSDVLAGGSDGVAPEDEPTNAGSGPEHIGPDRRAVLLTAVGAAAVSTLLTVGQTVPWLRKVSVLAVRDGSGPQDLPVNRTARAAGAVEAASDPAFTLTLRHGEAERVLTRADLAALPQRTHRLPIACVEGWSAQGTWTGVSVRDLLELVGAPPDATVRVRSLQTRGSFATSELPGAFVEDHRTLLALQLNGADLDLDHGFPCRIIAPNRPGVLQTKWVHELEVAT